MSRTRNLALSGVMVFWTYGCSDDDSFSAELEDGLAAPNYAEAVSQLRSAVACRNNGESETLRFICHAGGDLHVYIWRQDGPETVTKVSIDWEDWGHHDDTYNDDQMEVDQAREVISSIFSHYGLDDHPELIDQFFSTTSYTYRFADGTNRHGIYISQGADALYHEHQIEFFFAEKS